MPILTYADAARRAKVDASTLRRKVDRGQLSASTRPDGSRGIELSELARLYPHVLAQADTGGVPVQAQAPPVPVQDASTLAHELASAKARIGELEQDKAWLQRRVEVLEQRLLPAPKRGWVERLGELVERIRRR